MTVRRIERAGPTKRRRMNALDKRRAFEAAGGRCERCGRDIDGLAIKLRLQAEIARETGQEPWELARARRELLQAEGYSGKEEPGRPLYDLDHVRPLADGGPEEQGNRAVLCLPCHRYKTGGENHQRAKSSRLFTGHRVTHERLG